MSVWNAVILGLVQGITEFLPVSSSGHLSMINNLFNMSDIQSGHLFFEVLLHLATLISILIVYWKDIVAVHDRHGDASAFPYPADKGYA